MKHTLVLSFLMGLLLPVFTNAQDGKKPQADPAQEQKDRNLKKALSELQSALRERGDELSSNQLAEHAGWVLDKYTEWRALHPPEETQIEITPSPPLSNQAAAADPFADSNFTIKMTALNEYDFSFTLSSIFGQLIFAEADGSLSTFITLAKDHPVLRSDSIFTSMLNNYLISAKLLSVTSQKALIHSLPEAKVEPPAYLAKAAPNLKSAWRKAQFINNTIKNLYPDDDAEMTPYLGESESFDAVIAECLIDGNWKNADTIQDYNWGVWCGAGSEEFLWQKLNFLGILQTHKKQADKALALFLYSWLSTPNSYHSMLYDFDSDRWDELISTRLQQSGIDWESPACGMLLMDSLWIHPNRLTDSGRQETARLLSQSKELELPNSQKILEVLIGVIGRHSPYDRRYSKDPFAKSHGGKFALNPEDETQVIQTIASLTHKVAYGSEVTDAIELLAALAPKTSKDDLLKLASSPVPSVSQAAYDALKKNNYQEELKSISPSQQEEYKFTFHLDGEPLSNLPIYKEQILITSNRKSYTSFGWKTEDALDANGGIQFKRSNDTHASDTRGIFNIHPRGKNYTIPWTPKTPIFTFQENFADLKKRQGEIIDIPVYPLEIKLQIPKNRLPLADDAPPTLIIINTQPLPLDNIDEDWFLGSSRYKLNTHQDSIKIDRVGPGRYSLHVQVPGCVIFSQAEPISVTQKQQILVKLEPGHQLKYSLDNQRAMDFSVGLMRQSIDKKGREQWKEISEIQHDWQFINWNHLSPGKFQLVVFDQRNSSANPSVIDFKIKPGDPEIINLGKIKVPR